MNLTGIWVNEDDEDVSCVCWGTSSSRQFIMSKAENNLPRVGEMFLPGYIVQLVVLINSHLNVLERRLLVSQRWLSTPY